MKKRLISFETFFAFFALFAVLAVLPGCGKKEAAGPGGKGGKNAPRVFPVETQTVKTEPVQYRIEASGSLEPQEEVRVTARVAGVVENVAFEEGQFVKLDTVLADIDRSRYALLEARAKALYDKAVAERDRADTFLKNRVELKAKDAGWVSDEEIASAQSQANAAKAAAAEAKSAWDLARNDAAHAQVKSLVAGLIRGKSVSTGQYVPTGAEIATIVDTSRLKLRFHVTERESVGLQDVLRGDKKVHFTVRSIPGAVFEAELAYLSPRADVDTRTVECLAIIKTPDPRLKPGFFAVVTTVVKTRGQAVVVPDTAVLPTERGFAAFVVKDGKAVRRDVSPGVAVREGYVEVLKGLAPGERVVVTGSAALRDGVEVQEAAAPKGDPAVKYKRAPKPSDD